jgi:hypothetical protein
VDFGIKAAAMVGMRVYEDACRQTGRSTAAMKLLEDGDAFVVMTEKERAWAREALRSLGKIADVLVYRSRSFAEETHGRTGKLVFDHRVIQAIYEGALLNAEGRIRTMSAGAHDPTPRYATGDRVQPVKYGDWT